MNASIHHGLAYHGEIGDSRESKGSLADGAPLQGQSLLLTVV
jgi:hypothetical protein